jgi:hypothetical protein
VVVVIGPDGGWFEWQPTADGLLVVAPAFVLGEAEAAVGAFAVHRRLGDEGSAGAPFQRRVITECKRLCGGNIFNAHVQDANLGVSSGVRRFGVRVRRDQTGIRVG